jgi:hypothetical protein
VQKVWEQPIAEVKLIELRAAASEHVTAKPSGKPTASAGNTNRA